MEAGAQRWKDDNLSITLLLFSFTHLSGYFSYKSNSLLKWSKHHWTIPPHLREWSNLHRNFSDHSQSTCSVRQYGDILWHIMATFWPRMKWWMSGPMEFLGPWNYFSKQSPFWYVPPVTITTITMYSNIDSNNRWLLTIYFIVRMQWQKWACILSFHSPHHQVFLHTIAI